MIYQIFGYFLIYLQVDRLTDNQIVRFFTIIYILFIGYRSALKTGKSFSYKNLPSLYLVFVLMIVIAIIRSSSLTSTVINVVYQTSLYLSCTFFLITSLTYLVIKKNLDWKKISQYAIIYPLGMFVGLNLILWALDIRFANNAVVEDTTSAVMIGSLFGIHMKRVIFPLAGGGLNTYGDVCGVLLLFAIVASIYKFKIINIVIVGIAVASLILVDDRSFLFNAIAASIAIYYISKTKFLKYFNLAPLLIVILPFCLLTLLPIVYSSVSTVMLRQDENSNSLIRIFIWSKCANFLSDFNPMQLIGYGEYGHYSSGASKLWAYYFKDWKAPAFVSPHNSLFSTIFDYGYLGLLVYILVIRKSIIDGMSNQQTANDKYLTVFIVSFWIYYLVSGATETVNGFYSPGMIYLFQIIVLLSALTKFRMNIFLIQTESQDNS